MDVPQKKFDMAMYCMEQTSTSEIEFYKDDIRSRETPCRVGCS
jgi:hypothetical protein